MKFVGIEDYETLSCPKLCAKDIPYGRAGIYRALDQDALAIRDGGYLVVIFETGNVQVYDEPDDCEWEIERILKPGERVVLEA